MSPTLTSSMSSAIPISRFPHPRSNLLTHRDARPLLQISPQYVMFSVLQNVSSLTFRYPISVRLSHVTAKNKAATADEEESPTQSARPAISPLLCRPPRRSNAFVVSRAHSLILRFQRTSTAMSCTRVSSPASSSCPTPWSGMVSTVRKALIRINPASCLPWIFSPNPHTRTVLEYLLSGAPDPSAPSDQRCL